MAKTGFQINAGPSLMVLAMLRERGRYGYDIARELEELSDRHLSFQYGTLYPILHKLEKKGLVKGVWEHIEGERSRRLYVLTERGKADVERQIEDWTKYTHAVQRVLERTGP